jgi:hypothetical protein
MIWADKITLFLTITLFVLLFVFTLGPGTEAALPELFFQIAIKLALPLWAFLRIVDLIFGGRRRRRRLARPVLYVPPLYWG